MNEKQDVSIFYLIAAAPHLLALCKQTREFLVNSLDEFEKLRTEPGWDASALHDLLYEFAWTIDKSDVPGGCYKLVLNQHWKDIY